MLLESHRGQRSHDEAGRDVDSAEAANTFVMRALGVAEACTVLLTLAGDTIGLLSLSMGAGAKAG